MPRRYLVLLLLAGFAGACKHQEDGPTSPTPTNNTVAYSAVGASDGIGFGGSVPCIPFDPDCPNGTGYVYLLKRRLASMDEPLRSATGHSLARC